MESKNRKCNICQGKLAAHDKLKGLLCCEQCGFLTADVSISEDELKQLYGKDYFHGEEYGDYTRDRKTIQKNFRRRLLALNRFVENPEQMKLYEIGCAYGFFLDVARPTYKSVSGIDISSDAALYAQTEMGLEVVSGDYLDTNASFDVCCMWDTIEHLKHPEKFIEKISSEISPNGIVAITTGDIGSLNARVRGRKWRQIHPPTHLHYFSTKTLTLLLENNGFEVVYKQHVGNWMSLDTIAYIILVFRQNKKKLYDLLKKTKLLNLNAYMNMGDTVFILAKKRG